jgi:hypothetical protein
VLERPRLRLLGVRRRLAEGRGNRHAAALQSLIDKRLDDP